MASARALQISSIFIFSTLYTQQEGLPTILHKRGPCNSSNWSQNDGKLWQSSLYIPKMTLNDKWCLHHPKKLYLTLTLTLTQNLRPEIGDRPSGPQWNNEVDIGPRKSKVHFIFTFMTDPSSDLAPIWSAWPETQKGFLCAMQVS